MNIQTVTATVATNTTSVAAWCRSTTSSPRPVGGQQPVEAALDEQ